MTTGLLVFREGFNDCVETGYLCVDQKDLTGLSRDFDADRIESNERKLRTNGIMSFFCINELVLLLT